MADQKDNHNKSKKKDRGNKHQHASQPTSGQSSRYVETSSVQSASHQQQSYQQELVTLERAWGSSSRASARQYQQAPATEGFGQYSPMGRWLSQRMAEEPYHTMAAIAEEAAGGHHTSSNDKDGASMDINWSDKA